MERTQSFHGHPLGAVGWVARAVQTISSIIVLGITAWAVTDTKSLTVIFTLVTVCYSNYHIYVSNNIQSVISIFAVACSTFTSCVGRNHRWHALVLIVTDGTLSYL
jgi:hypothetical protein